MLQDDADKILGFHATTTEQYSAAFSKALDLGAEETLAMRLRARKSAKRFTEEAFAEAWIREAEKAVALDIKRRN